MDFISIASWGAVGCSTRYILNIVLPKTGGLIPHDTLVANLVGSFLLGLAFTYFDSKSLLHTSMAKGVLIGFCGGLTTFSTFSSQLLSLIQTNNFKQLALYLTLSVILSVLLVFLGKKSYFLLS